MSLCKTILVLICVTLLSDVAAQQNLQMENRQYEELRHSSLSPDGEWIFYTLRYPGDDDTTFLKNINSKDVRKFPGVKFGRFVGRGRYFLAMKNNDLSVTQLLNLKTNNLVEYQNVTMFQESNDGDIVIFRNTKSNVLTILNLVTGNEIVEDKVTEFNFSAAIGTVAFIKADSTASSLCLIDVKSGVIRTVLKKGTNRLISRLTWQENGNGLAFFSTKNANTKTVADISIFLIIVRRNKFLLYEYDGRCIPDDMQINPDGNLQIVGDGKTVILDVRKKTLTDSKPSQEKLSKVEIWHYNDKEVGKLKDESSVYKAAWSFSTNTFFQITNDCLPNYQGINFSNYGIAFNINQYRPSFAGDSTDFYLVNYSTDSLKCILKKQKINSESTPLYPSPGGKYIAYFKNLNWWIYDIKNNTHTNATKDIPFPLCDSGDMRIMSVNKPFGLVGWTRNDEQLIVQDQYDIYSVNHDRQVLRRLTSGRKEGIKYEIENLDWSAPGTKVIDLSNPILMRMTSRLGWKSGYFLWEPGNKGRIIIFNSDKNYLSKAKEKNIFLLRRENSNMSAELAYISNNAFEPQLIVKTNKDLNPVNGRSELVQFKNSHGQLLQGALFYPKNYHEGIRYPMIVEVYETLSNSIREFPQVDGRGGIDEERLLTNHGYFLFRPDIAYVPDNPGFSASDCVISGVQAVLLSGMIDSSKIGLTGHSFGGFETGFILTQTSLFSAAIAKAGVYDLVSFALEETTAREPGFENFEYRQFRIYGNLTNKLKNYIGNSTVINADKISTPLLIAAGKMDDVVPYNQSLELYFAMRRSNKKSVLLTYDRGGHLVADSLSDRLDFTSRQKDWWDHYLLRKPAAEWIKSESFQ
jgi:dipeptidyl aminopeptidase/acylaminoacyl peptidase